MPLVPVPSWLSALALTMPCWSVRPAMVLAAPRVNVPAPILISLPAPAQAVAP